MESTGAQSMAGLLEEMLRSEASTDDLTRRLFELNVARVRADDPELGALMLSCAVPRKFDERIIGVLRDAEEDGERNKRILQALTRYSFVIPRRDSYAYHDSIRDMLLNDWRKPEKREEFGAISSRLVSYFERLHKEAQRAERDLAQVARIVQRVNRLRYAELASLVEQSLLMPLLEALYHETLRSPRGAYTLFTRYCEAYEAVGRLGLCELLLKGAQECFSKVAGPEGAPWRNWLRYWEGRLAGRRRRHAEAENLLSALLPECGEDVKLRLWVLGELSNALQEQYKLAEARERSRESLALALETQEDRYNLPVAHARVADLDWILLDYEAAEQRIRLAIDSARESSNPRMEVYLSLSLSGLLLDSGRWSEAFDAALTALQQARRLFRGNPETQQAVLQRFMSLFARRDPRLLHSVYSEAEEMANLLGDPVNLFDLRKDYAAQLRRGGCLSHSDELFEELQREAGGYPAVPSSECAPYISAFSHSDLVFQTALLRESQGKRPQADDLYGQVLERGRRGEASPWHVAAALSNRGVNRTVAGDWQAAESDLKQAIELWSQMGHSKIAAFVTIFRATCQRRQGRLEEARQLLESARAHLDECNIDSVAEYHRVLADVYRDQGQLSESAAHLRESIRLAGLIHDYENCARSHAEMGVLMSGQGLWSEAVRHAAEAAGFWAFLAANEAPQRAQCKASDRMNALAMRSFVTAAGPAKAALVDAKDRLKAAVAAEGGNLWFQSNLAFVCEELAHWEEAAEALESGLRQAASWLRSTRLYVRAAGYRSREADAHLLAGDSGAAESALGLAHTWLDRAADDPEAVEIRARAHLRLALIEALRSRSWKALRELKHAIQAQPGAAFLSHAKLLGEMEPMVTSRERYHAWTGLLRLCLADTGVSEGALQAIRESLLRLAGEIYRRNSRFGREMEQAVSREAGLNSATPAAPLVVEAHDSLFPVAEGWENTHPLFREYLPGMRERVRRETGFRLPGVRIRARTELPEASYVILLNGVPVVTGQVDPERRFCADPEAVRAILGAAAQSQLAYNPATGSTDGAWLDESEAGDTPCWDYFLYLTRHLEAVARRNLESFAGIQETEYLLNDWIKARSEDRAARQALVDEALSVPDARARLVTVLKGLIREMVPVSRLDCILETFATAAQDGKDDSEIVEAVRRRIKDQLPGNSEGRQLFRLSPEFERRLSEGIAGSGGKRFLALEPIAAQDLISAARQELEGREHSRIAILASPEIRPFAARLLEIEFASVPLLALDELMPGRSADQARLISLDG
jgi:tetratricopeptide (TPR) repeat protein